MKLLKKLLADLIGFCLCAIALVQWAMGYYVWLQVETHSEPWVGPLSGTLGLCCCAYWWMLNSWLYKYLNKHIDRIREFVEKLAE
jgi:hypothetical protein